MIVIMKPGADRQQVDHVVAHQANLRISQAVQRRLGLSDDQVFNNIERYGNTTAASISKGWRSRISPNADRRATTALGSARMGRRKLVTTVKKKVAPGVKARLYSGILRCLR